MALGIIDLVITVHFGKKENGNWPRERPYEVLSELQNYGEFNPDGGSTEGLFEGKLVLIKDQAQRFYYTIPRDERRIIETRFLTHLSGLDDGGWGVLSAAQQFLVEKEKESFWDRAIFEPEAEQVDMFQLWLGSFAVSLPKNTI